MGIFLLYSLLIITAVNITAYVWAYFKQSDHLTDLSYNACFFILILILFYISPDKGWGKILMTSMVAIWAFRLGAYLFYRINKMKKDRRFDRFRGDWMGFLKFWVLQSISIWVIALPAIVFMLTDNPSYWMPGMIVWAIGFILETIADAQKFSFKQQHPDQFMDKGLFSIVQFPNYTGEILCWIGVFLFTLPSISGMEWLTVVSPLWIIILLLFISGIPLLEKQYEKKYGNTSSYKSYLKSTPKLVPFIY
jgi:steroid 5-alpha reductase family enzyme